MVSSLKISIEIHKLFSQLKLIIDFEIRVLIVNSNAQNNDSWYEIHLPIVTVDASS